MSTEQSQRADLRFGTIPGMLAKRAAEAADHVAIEDGDVTLTYAQLAAKVREASASLIAIGVARGDRVGIWAPNLWEWIVSALDKTLEDSSVSAKMLEMGMNLGKHALAGR